MMFSFTRKRRFSSRRRGASLYLVVLGVSLIVGVIALTSSEIGRLGIRGAQEKSEARIAAVQARSGIEFALNWLNHHPDWRTSIANEEDQEITYYDYPGRYGFTWRVTDIDGDLADDTRDHAVLRAVGWSRAARAVLEVDIEPCGRALTCLEAVMHAGHNIDVKESGVIKGSGFISANHDVKGNNSDIQLDAEAENKVSGSNYTGLKTEGITPREMPSEHVFNYYIKRGTRIDINDLPTSGSTRKLEKLVLGPKDNPFGEANPWGIYVIDCEGQKLCITWIRLSGTLVLLNLGADSEAKAPLMLDSRAPNQPALLVEGDIKVGTTYQFFSMTIDYMSEAYSNTNFNPVTLPYNGESDNAKDDNLPSRITGGIYSTKKITFHQDCNFEGFLVAKDIRVNDDKSVTATYHPYALNYPPSGFSTGEKVRILPGTWRRTGLD